MNLKNKILTILGVSMASLLMMSYINFSNTRSIPTKEGELALLVNDNYSQNDNAVQVWIQAAKEEGIKMEILSSSDMLRADSTNNKSYDRFAGIIIPDTIHKKGGDALISKIKEYTKNGGKTMVIYDALTYENTGQFSSGFFYKGKAPLSEVVGIDYALYDKFKEKTMSLQQIFGTTENFELFQLPPGKYEVDKATQKSVIKTYGYDKAIYPVFKTGRVDDGVIPLLTASDGSIVSSLYSYGKGQSFFINMPVTYLKSRTDGAFLNGFLYYFAKNVVQVPMLSRTPNNKGIGILNLHVDSNAAINPLLNLDKEGFFENGPFSIHITAGPDTYELKDGLGFNLDNNLPMQQLLKKLQGKGHEIGSHGGWAHNYYANHVKDDNEKEFSFLLEKNHKSVSKLIGKNVTEYSSPEGVTPDWVVHWLQKNNIKAYYLTGNIGMAPTRTFREGKLIDTTTWSFPVSTSGRAATFEEAFMYNKTEYEMGDWISNLLRFVIQQKTARLIYFHPPGAMPFMDAIYKMIDTAKINKKAGTFEWRTMSDYADFLTKREKTNWDISAEDNILNFNLTNPDTLKDLVFELPKSKYKIADSKNIAYTEDSSYYYIRSNSKELDIKVIKK